MSTWTQKHTEKQLSETGADPFASVKTLPQKTSVWVEPEQESVLHNHPTEAFVVLPPAGTSTLQESLHKSNLFQPILSLLTFQAATDVVHQTLRHSVQIMIGRL